MRLPAVGVVVVALLLVFSLCTFRVDQRERAILLFLGKIVEADYEPGLHFKLPPPFHTVRKFDRRILSLDSEPERFLTSEKKDVIVDSYVRWRITDVSKYFVATNGDERRAGLLLFQRINAGLREEFARRTVQQVVSGERGTIMRNVAQQVGDQATELGLAIVDVRIKRIDLPDEVRPSVFERMRAERTRVARDFRSRGAEAAERITANADRERTVLLAEAYRDAETLRGEGDALAAQTYAEAYSRDREFYSLYRSLLAYRSSFGSKDDVLVLQPDSEFFRYFGNPRGESAP